jgi:hypothetical protein
LGRKINQIIILFIIGLFTIGSAFAQFTPEPPPLPRFKLSFTERFRFVSFDNTLDLNSSLDDKTVFSRHRTSLAAHWRPNRKLEFGVKLTNENRNYFVPEGRDFNWHEVFVDNLYIKVNKPGNLPLSFTIGRQDIMIGEGFLVREGNPMDGTRTFYFNAIRLDLFPKKGYRASIFYMGQPEFDDIGVIINDQHQRLVEQPEKSFVVNVAGQHRKLYFDSYFIRKNIEATETNPRSSGINTLGSLVRIPLLPSLSFTGEAAYQFGSYGDFDRDAVGAHFHLDFRPTRMGPQMPAITVGGIFLAGDNPNTENLEGWDPLFSRWPIWSPSYIYILKAESGGKPAYWSNLTSIFQRISLGLFFRMRLTLAFHHMKSTQILLDGPDFIGGVGKTRGNLFSSRLSIIFNKNLSGYLLWETFSPGNFYRPDADRYNWIRFELMLRI